MADRTEVVEKDALVIEHRVKKPQVFQPLYDSAHQKVGFRAIILMLHGHDIR